MHVRPGPCDSPAVMRRSDGHGLRRLVGRVVAAGCSSPRWRPGRRGRRPAAYRGRRTTGRGPRARAAEARDQLAGRVAGGAGHVGGGGFVGHRRGRGYIGGRASAHRGPRGGALGGAWRCSAPPPRRPSAAGRAALSALPAPTTPGTSASTACRVDRAATRSSRDRGRRAVSPRFRDAVRDPVHHRLGQQKRVRVALRVRRRERPRPLPDPGQPAARRQAPTRHALIVDRDAAASTSCSRRRGWTVRRALARRRGRDLEPALEQPAARRAGRRPTPRACRSSPASRARTRSRGSIGHALRFTVPRTRDAFVYPARHAASSLTDPDCRRWACASG